MIVFTASGQIFFKLFFKKNNYVFIILSIMSFVIVPFFSALSLRLVSIDTVYMMTSITILLVLAGSKFIFKEAITRRKLISAALIISGVIIYNL